LTRVGVIINPRSGRGNGKGLALAERLKASSADVVVVERFTEIEPILARFCAANVELICVSSGDGTIQHIQTLLAETFRPKPYPRLCLLPHGTTNMTAADIGFRSRSLAAQAAFIAGPVVKIAAKRASLRIVGADDGLARHGMFLGTGAIALATKYCQTALNDKGIHGSWATAATLGIALLRAGLGRQAKDDPTRFDQPHQINLTVDGLVLAEGQNLLALCTTLEKLILGSRPFWGGQTNGIRCTTLGFPIPSLLRWTYPMLYGNETRHMPNVARSVTGQNIVLNSSTPFVLDGEFYNGRELQIEAGPVVEYIVQ
jgi:diacylglycerol kinase (ATP)